MPKNARQPAWRSAVRFVVGGVYAAAGVWAVFPERQLSLRLAAARRRTPGCARCGGGVTAFASLATHMLL